MKKNERKNVAVEAEETEKGAECSSVSAGRIRKNRKVNAYEHAKQVYERIQQQKAQEKIARQLEIQKKHEAMEQYQKSKKQMNKVLRKCNKKGQPNLGAQMEMLLKKIEKQSDER
ncbi:unnamed protein product [Nippostrongylus brasiliensis]|uniref:Uncharacterized protein n=1 Tax=Nippostrongylus brasiliensis TaxID=27835 RepID=A0A0N4XDL7_NIPBR|nr:unnamed protein product [Nippostrongylus brasiliensis]